MLGKINRWLLVSATVALSFCPVTATGLGWFGNDLQGNPCKGSEQGFGPYDYFDVNDPSDKLWQEGRLWEANKIHYGKGMRDMREGRIRGAGGEFRYTLMAYPNHPNALYAVIQLYIEARDNPTNTKERWPDFNQFTPPECWLQRALAFRPKQAHIYLLFGLYLHKIGLKDQALKYYRQASALQPENAEIYYNTGLLLVDMGRFGEAKAEAIKAYQLKYPLPGLKRKLKAAGYWDK